MKIRFAESEIAYYAGRYKYRPDTPEPDRASLSAAAPLVGHLTAPQLQQLASWKAPRSAAHASGNQNDKVSFLREISEFALSTTCERSRISVLTLLDGVSWPMASVLLIFVTATLIQFLTFGRFGQLALKSQSRTHLKFGKNTSDTAANSRTGMPLI
jgi:hypothetical protein